jgi:hypothetical protein
MSSTGELDSATPRLRISECARPSLRQLDLIRASYRRRIGDSPTDQVSKIHSPIWSRGRTAHSSHPPLGWSVDSYSRHQLAAYCSPRFNQLRSTRRVSSAQTKSNPGSNSATSSSHRSHNSPTCARDDARSEATYRERKRLRLSPNQPQ